MDGLHIRNANMTSTNGCVILVTGGTGFLGQHLVGLLQEHADHVTEIRVLDVVPYENKLGKCAQLQLYEPISIGNVLVTACLKHVCMYL